MLKLISSKARNAGASEALIAFVQSLELHGGDDMSICAGALDIVRAYLGDRPACLWKNTNGSLEKISERGLVELFFKKESEQHKAALTRALVSGSSEFDPCPFQDIAPEFKSDFDGFLHIPVKTHLEIRGLFTLAVWKKEARDRAFVQPLECLGHLIGMALQANHDHKNNLYREKQLKAEVNATTRELEQTNSRLIDRVKELKMLYQELQKRVQELTRANHAKNEFLSVVSHELRTPLTSLTGFLCVLLEEEAGPLNDQQRRFLGITKQSADRLNLLISDLLDVSRIESGHLNLVMGVHSMVDIIEQSIENLHASALTKGIELRLHCQSNVPDIWGDPSRLQQVVDNLLSNAIKFTPSAGFIEVSCVEKGDCILVSIHDSGIGLSLQDKEKVFDMFYQADASTRRATGGAGLGLAIARGIVAIHGGEIWVESELGQGATFSFMIPRHKAQKAA